MKTTIYIHAVKHAYDSAFKLMVNSVDMEDYYRHSGGGTTCKLLDKREIDVAFPAEEELVGLEIDGLEEAITEIRAQAARQVERLHERIAKLRCLEHAPS